MGCHQSKQADDALAPRAKVSSSSTTKTASTSQRRLARDRVTSYNQDDLTAELVQHTHVADIHALFRFDDVIGTGHFGCVKKAVSLQSGKEWAIKIVKLSNEVDRDALRNEIHILRRLHHPQIVRVLASYEDSKGMYMVMQLCKGKELYEHVYKDQRQFSEDDVRKLMRALLRAVAFLHSNFITHRDLKLENLLLEDAADPATLKLCDFGLSTRFKRGEKLQKSLGTIDYVAPEVLDGEYTEKCDLWSVGVICYELLTGVSPFHAATVDETMGKIFDGALEFKDNVWRKYSPHAITFLKALVKENVDARLSATQALGHKWLRDLDQQEEIDQTQRLQSHKRLLLTNMLSFSRCRKMKQTALLSVALGVSEDRIHQAMAAEVFHSIDTNRCGTLTHDEFCAAMVQCGISQDDASELFTRINQSKSGRINFLEFMAAVMDQRDIGQNTIKEAFGLLDGEKKGRLSIVGLQDVFKHSLVAEEVQEMITSADTKGDGYVDFEEFQDLFRLPPQVAVASPLATVAEEQHSQRGFSSSSASLSALGSFVETEGMENGSEVVATTTTEHGDDSRLEMETSTASPSVASESDGTQAVVLSSVAVELPSGPADMAANSSQTTALRNPEIQTT